MKGDIIERRERAMDQAMTAIEGVWPTRTGGQYVREMRSALDELESIAAEMDRHGIDRVEQSRTYRYIGSLYADLGPALGPDMLLNAKKAFQSAERLLEGQRDEWERAKLNFNFANTLRLMDPNDDAQLAEARQRLLDARAFFVAVNAVPNVAKVDLALQSVDGLLTLAPLAAAVKESAEDMNPLQESLAAGTADLDEIAKGAHEVMSRGGGIGGMLVRVQAIIDALPAEQKEGAAFEQVQEQIARLQGAALEGSALPEEARQGLSALTERLNQQVARSDVSPDHAKTLANVLKEFGKFASSDEHDVAAMMAKAQAMRGFVNTQFEMSHYPTYGLKRPPAGSRAADLVEMNWHLRRHLLEEMNRADNGKDEGNEILNLTVRASNVDRRLYEAADDDSRAVVVEQEELRPLALAVRNFSARGYTMPARPLWGVAPVPVNTNAVFYSGFATTPQSIAAVCGKVQLDILQQPKGDTYAAARWKQLQEAITGIFDLRVTTKLKRASVSYELGMALALGKPLIVLAGGGGDVPFDVDIAPVIFGDASGSVTLSSALDRSAVWTYPMARTQSVAKTLDAVLAAYPRPHANMYVDQTLRLLGNLRETADPLAVARTLGKFFEYLDDGVTRLIQPRWLPVYPDQSSRRLFHVTPFRTKWAERVTETTRKLSEAAGARYVRGDEVPDPNVIRSIWDEIARSTHVLVDLTGFSANVALELGIAHVLGKNVLMLAQDTAIDNLFPSIKRLRVVPYSMTRIAHTLEPAIRPFVEP